MGVPAGGLDDAVAGKIPGMSVEAARIGRAGELATARVLGGWAARPAGPTVLHDLGIPLPGVRANIDHVVVSGRRVQILDSKVWRAGLYWTVPGWLPGHGRSFRGWSRFSRVAGRAPQMAVSGLQRLFVARLGVAVVEMAPPMLVVWPYQHEAKVRVGLLSPPDGVRVTAGRRLGRFRAGLSGSADPNVVAVLATLLPDRRGAGTGGG